MPNPTRFSVYAGEPISRALDGHDNRSGRLNGICERYLDVITDELRRIALTRAEWCAVMDVANGAHIETGDATGWRYLWASISDEATLDAKWSINREALSVRIRNLPLAAQVAIHEAAIRFWTHTDLDTDAALAKAGIVPSAA